jgi:hypothetical protein
MDFRGDLSPRQQCLQSPFEERIMMITWKPQSQEPGNADNFGTISTWWKSLEQKSVLWKQRLVPEEGDVDWNSQRFDETFTCAASDVRGITLFWNKENDGQERSITPGKLEFDPLRQHLYVYPESQKDLVISVEIPGVVREALKLKNPVWFGESIFDTANTTTGYRLTIQDTTNSVEIHVDMDEGSLDVLKSVVNAL